MSFRIENHEPFFDAIHRIAYEQTDQAIALLADDQDIHESIHETRKTFKRLRALLRLVRDNLPAETYRLENRFYRDSGRQLADLRDVTSLMEALDRLLEQHPEERLKEAILENKASLDEKREAIAKQFRTEKLPGQVKANLQIAQKRIPEWAFSHSGKQAFLRSIPRIYKRGRNAMGAAYKKRKDEDFHEWRKNVKYLWHQLQVVEKIWKTEMKALIKSLKSLSDDLGEDHDFTLIKEHVKNGSLQFPDEIKPVLDEQLAQEQQIRRKKAYYLGRRLYAEKPSAFGERLYEYWKIRCLKHRDKISGHQ